MIWFYERINGCWYLVHKSVATWASLRHIAGPILAGCIGVAVLPPITPLEPPQRPVREEAPMPALDPGLSAKAYLRPDARPVPEPGAVWALAVGVAGLVLVRRVP